MKAASHPLQQQRMNALRRYDILDTPIEQDFDEIVRLASDICNVPVSVINFIDEKRQWFKAEVGLGVRETPLDTSICSHVILQDEFVEIFDTMSDQRLVDNPLCFSDGGFRFYAGALLKSEDNLPLGTLCVLDYEPRELTAKQRELIRVLAKQVMKQLELRRALAFQLVLRKEVYHRVTNSLSSVASMINLQKQQSSDPVFHDAFDAIEGRINTIARLHRELCHADVAEKIDLKPFMGRVGQYLSKIAGPTIRIDIEFDNVVVDSKRASAIAIIVNEFIANSLKHAFPKDRDGAVVIRGTITSAGALAMQCYDNGVGSNGEIDVGNDNGGLGMMIIDVTASQLNAERRVESSSEGFSMDLIIPLND